jgi:hypothetical protein
MSRLRYHHSASSSLLKFGTTLLFAAIAIVLFRAGIPSGRPLAIQTPLRSGRALRDPSI